LKTLRHPFPIRIWHWLFAPAMILEVITGLSLSYPNPAPGLPNLRSVKKAHFTVGFILAGLYIAYLFDRRKYPDIFPTPKDLFIGLPKFLSYEFFLTKKKPKFEKYNPGQKFLYTLWLFLIPFLLVLGLFLYLPRLFMRPLAWIGGLNNARRLIHLGTVVMAASISGHIFFGLTHSIEVLKSIFIGSFNPQKQ